MSGLLSKLLGRHPDPDRVADPERWSEIDAGLLVPGTRMYFSVAAFCDGGLKLIVKASERLSIEAYADVIEAPGIAFVHDDEKSHFDDYVREHFPALSAPTLLDINSKMRTTTLRRQNASQRIYQFIKYFQRAVRPKSERLDPQGKVPAFALQKIREAAENELMSWFFESIAADEILYFSARVSALALHFAATRLRDRDDEWFDVLAMSAMIHELTPEGIIDGGKTLNSDRTLEVIRRDFRVLPEPVALTLRQLDERYDGTGAPHQLKGADILEQAQIIALAGQFERMRGKSAADTRRTKLDQARLEIIGVAPAFDPALLRSFIAWTETYEVFDP